MESLRKQLAEAHSVAMFQANIVNNSSGSSSSKKTSTTVVRPTATVSSVPVAQPSMKLYKKSLTKQEKYVQCKNADHQTFSMCSDGNSETCHSHRGISSEQRCVITSLKFCATGIGFRNIVLVLMIVIILTQYYFSPVLIISNNFSRV